MKFGLLIPAYLALGRTGVIAVCLLLGQSFLVTLIVTLLIDLVQIPVIGALLEASHKTLRLNRALVDRLGRLRERWHQRLEQSRFWALLGRNRALAVMAVSTIPLRGFGVISASILCFSLGFSRVYGTVLIMTGSLVGALVTMAVLREPVRILNGL